MFRAKTQLGGLGSTRTCSMLLLFFLKLLRAVNTLQIGQALLKSQTLLTPVILNLRSRHRSSWRPGLGCVSYRIWIVKYYYCRSKSDSNGTRTSVCVHGNNDTERERRVRPPPGVRWWLGTTDGRPGRGVYGRHFGGPSAVVRDASSKRPPRKSARRKTVRRAAFIVDRVTVYA